MEVEAVEEVVEETAAVVAVAARHLQLLHLELVPLGPIQRALRRHRLALRRELDVAVAGVRLLAVAARQVAVDHAAVALAQAAQRVDVDALLVEVHEEL